MTPLRRVVVLLALVANVGVILGWRALSRQPARVPLPSPPSVAVPVIVNVVRPTSNASGHDLRTFYMELGFLKAKLDSLSVEPLHVAVGAASNCSDPLVLPRSGPKKFGVTIITSPMAFSLRKDYSVRQFRVAFNWLREFRHAGVPLQVAYIARNGTESVAEVAAELGFSFGLLGQDSEGFDTLDSLIDAGERIAQHDVILLLNSDCFMGPDFALVLQDTLAELERRNTGRPFLITGRRYVWDKLQLQFDPYTVSRFPPPFHVSRWFAAIDPFVC